MSYRNPTIIQDKYGLAARNKALTDFNTSMSNEFKKLTDAQVARAKENEKIEAKKAMFEVFNQAAASEQKNITERWQSDMSSDNILSKTVRPAVLIFLILSTIVLIFIDSGFITFVVDDEWKELLKLILMTTVAAYFGGRSYEKGTKIKNR